MISRSFYFVRHGETDWNREGVLQGFSDIPLNETGRDQARAASSLIAALPVSRLVASPLQRASETASIINQALQKPIDHCADLRERHFGVFEGKSVREIEALKARMAADALAAEENGYPCPPEAESYADFKARSIGSFNRWLDLYASETLMFVCHGGIYRVLRRALTGEVDSSPNVQPYFFEKRGEAWLVHKL